MIAEAPRVTKYLSLEQVADLVDVPVNTVILWAREGKLKVASGPGSRFEFDPATVGAFLIEHGSSLKNDSVCVTCGSDLRLKRNPIVVSGLSISTLEHYATYRGQNIFATPTEFKMLVLLAQRFPAVVTYEQMIMDVWGRDYDPFDEFKNRHLLRVNTTRLRKRLREAGAPRDLIRTVEGIGYVLARQEEPC